MTAVEWLLKILEAQKEDAFNYDEWLITFNHALEMEKEQFEKLKDFRDMERMERYIIIVMCFFCLSSFYESTWYNLEGNITKSGEVFKSNKMTCASNKFPIGAVLKVTNTKNKRSVIVVRVNDCGKMSDNVIDLSRGAFKKIAKLEEGRINVRVNIIKWK